MKTVGTPDLTYSELTPIQADEDWLDAADIDDAPFFVEFTDVTFSEADGYTLYAPEDEADGGNGVDRTLLMGNTELIFRTSTYANFATSCLPMGKLTVTGLLTRYNSSWQMVVRTADDIVTED